jgi:hypothetical protein
MKEIQLPAEQDDIIKVRISISTQCTFTSKYVSVKERVFRGNSEYCDQPDYITGTVEELAGMTNEFSVKLANADNEIREYSIELKWLHFKDEEQVGELSAISYSGELNTGESFDIQDTFMFKS